MGVRVEIEYTGNLRTVVTHGPSGDTFETEAPVDNGGTGMAISPTDLVAAAWGSCILTIMALVARKLEVDLTGAQVWVEKEMSTAPPRRIRSLKAVVTLPAGLSLSESDRETFEKSAEGCPVKHSLHPDVELQIEYVYPTDCD
jgi:putative redox protein